MFGGQRQTMVRIPASLQNPSLSDYQLLYNPDHPKLKLMSAMSMNYTTVATLNRSGNKKFASISYS